MSGKIQTLQLGTNLGPYKILRKLGEGGMGEVYEALDERLHRQAVIKVISKSAVTTMGTRAVENFLREARALGRINHVNIVTVYAIDKISDIDFIAMERLEGSDLGAILKYMVLTAVEAAPLLLQMLEGLGALHASNILHRDLKPANLILRPNGQIKLLDFGLAKFLGDEAKNDKTATMVFEGTLLYTAPELAGGAPPSKQSDLWSLGAIFYECMVGRRMVDSPDPNNFLLTLEYVKKVSTRTPPECDVWIPPAARAILHGLCAKNLGERFPSTAEAIAAVRAFLATHLPEKDSFYRNITRNISHADQVLSEIQGRGFSAAQSKRILTLSVLDEANSQTLGELSLSDTQRFTPDKPLTVSPSAIERSVATFTSAQLLTAETKVALKIPRAKIDAATTLQYLAGFLFAATLGYFAWILASHPRNRTSPSGPVTTAPTATAIPRAPANSSPSPSPPPSAGSPPLVNVTKPTLITFHQFPIEINGQIPPELAKQILSGLEQQLEITESVITRPKFIEYLHSVRIIVVPGQTATTIVGGNKTILIRDRPMTPNNPVMLHAHLLIFYAVASKDVLDHNRVGELYRDALNKHLLNSSSGTEASDQAYFARVATAFLYGHSGEPALSRETLKRVQPECYEFLENLFSAFKPGRQRPRN